MYPYKGFYGLLSLGLQNYRMDLYRGLSGLFDATPGSYIRFNRFTSATPNVRVAQQFAGMKGTIFIIKGDKMAYYISPVSFFPNENEYLLSPEIQYRVVSVINSPTGVRTVTLQAQPYA